MFIPPSCPHCGTKGKLELVKYIYRDKNDEIISADIPALECQECGGFTFNMDSYKAKEEAYKAHKEKSAGNV